MGSNAPQQRHNTFVIRSEVSGRFPPLPHLGTRRHGVTPPNAGHCPTLPHLGTRQIRWGRSTESRGVCFLRGHARALAPAQDCPHPPARAGRAWRTARPAGARPTTGAPAPAAHTVLKRRCLKTTEASPYLRRALWRTNPASFPSARFGFARPRPTGAIPRIRTHRNTTAHAPTRSHPPEHTHTGIQGHIHAQVQAHAVLASQPAVRSLAPRLHMPTTVRTLNPEPATAPEWPARMLNIPTTIPGPDPCSCRRPV